MGAMGHERIVIVVSMSAARSGLRNFGKRIGSFKDASGATRRRALLGDCRVEPEERHADGGLWGEKGMRVDDVE